MEELKIEYLSINDLKPYDRNARKHQNEDVAAIVNSIKEFGFSDPIGVWGDENTIVEGHGRLEAAKKLKMDKVPVIHLDHLTDEQRRAYALAHNKTAELSSWMDDVLSEELDNIFDIDMEDFGFNLDSLDEEPEIYEDEVPDEGKSVSKLGDLWQLGQHRLICGDSTDISVIERLMNERKADLLITDPPYNVDYEGGTKDKLKIMNDKMDNNSFRQFLRDAFSSADTVMRGGAVFYIWHADSEGYNFRGACNDVGWKVRECLIWNKNSMVMGRQDYQWKHEPCLYGWKDGASHLWASDRKQVTVLNFDKPIRNDVHPTMKPVSLFAYQIGNNTHEGDAVLDLFGGSGTTIVACEELNRNAYSCELDPHHVDIIIQRYINLKDSDEDVFLIQGDKKIPYSEVIKEN